MLDWFVLLSPLLLLALVLPYVFVGCTATLSGAPISLDAIVNLKYPTFPVEDQPQTDKIMLAWTVVSARVEEVPIEDDTALQDPQRSFIDDLTQDSYRHLFNNPTPGSWTVSCAYYTWEEGPQGGEPISHRWGEAECTFQFLSSAVLTFEIISDEAGGWLVQSAEDGCPE